MGGVTVNHKDVIHNLTGSRFDSVYIARELIETTVRHILDKNGAQGRIKFVWNKFSMSVFYE